MASLGEHHCPIKISWFEASHPSPTRNLQQPLKISLGLHQHCPVSSIFQVPAVQFLKVGEKWGKMGKEWEK